MQGRTFAEEFERAAVELARQVSESKARVSRYLVLGGEQEGWFVLTRTGSGEMVSTQEFEGICG